MKVLLLLVLLVAIAVAVYLVLTALARRRAPQPRWRVETTTRPDGTLEVAVRGDADQRRVVRALEPGLEGAELAAELRLAKEEAQMQADELNR